MNGRGLRCHALETAAIEASRVACVELERIRGLKGLEQYEALDAFEAKNGIPPGLKQEWESRRAAALAARGGGGS